MVYVLDTNIFRKLLDHFPKKGTAFKMYWEKIDEKIEEGSIISVDECFNELMRHFSSNNINANWLKERKKMFKNPTDEESVIIRDLFCNRKMMECVSRKNILENRPVADAYLCAKAKSINGILVTDEKYKPNAAKLPNLCEEIKVKCISYDEFMEELSLDL